MQEWTQKNKIKAISRNWQNNSTEAQYSKWSQLKGETQQEKNDLYFQPIIIRMKV